MQKNNILLYESPELLFSCQICIRILSCTELQLHLSQLFIQKMTTYFQNAKEM